MVDIHCHLLPGIDDGPNDLAAALQLAQRLVDDGMSHVVCTPHVFPGRFENRASSIEVEFALFRKSLIDAAIPLAISWAGEVRLTPEILDYHLPRAEVPFLGRSQGMQNMLLEMPDGQVPLGADRFTQKLLSGGIRPVIAHPERNRGVMERLTRIQPYVEDGCYLQVTAGALVGQFGARAQQAAHQLIDFGWVHVVASDAHNLAGRRPRMSDARDYIVDNWGSDVANKLTMSHAVEICGMSERGAQSGDYSQI